MYLDRVGGSWGERLRSALLFGGLNLGSGSVNSADTTVYIPNHSFVVVTRGVHCLYAVFFLHARLFFACSCGRYILWQSLWYSPTATVDMYSEYTALRILIDMFFLSYTCSLVDMQ